MAKSFGLEFEGRFAALKNPYDVRGIVTDSGRIIPFGTDTKVLSTVFESIARPVVKEVADQRCLAFHEALRQNVYPDFTLMHDDDDPAKIAVDVKTTYRAGAEAPVSFTLGSYTSFLRQDHRGIEFPYSQYAEHWIIAFVYSRPLEPPPADFYALGDLHDVPPPFSDVEMFTRLKWQLAGAVAGSGNTANIGSRRGTVSELRDGAPLFADETEFLSYWRGYERTADARARAYSDLAAFRRQTRPEGKEDA
ncbi:MAG: restriction endonuclease [Actinomycetota bacterium]|nr:restriction endonuclease [Actinomycetota bacterium]